MLAPPLGAALALEGLGIFCLALRRIRVGSALVSAGFVLLWVASTPAVAAWLALPLERGVVSPALPEIEPADAILLLGGAMKPALPPREFGEVGEAGDRVLHAARLYRAGKAPVVLVSGGRLPMQRGGPPEAATIESLLVALGVPVEAIVREEESTNTHENCARARNRLAEFGASDVLLVTSALHMRRALATCRHAGISARPAPTDYLVAGHLGWRPTISALSLTEQALHEWIGFVVYLARGWITNDQTEAAL